MPASTPSPGGKRSTAARGQAARPDALYAAGQRGPERVDVPARRFLMVDGLGDPDRHPEYREALEAVYAVAQSLKSALRRKGDTHEFHVQPPECLLWTEANAFEPERRDDWKWTVMLPVPEFVTAKIADDEIGHVRERRKLPALDGIRLERFEEGTCVQVLHVGPYDHEPETIAALLAYAYESGHRPHGKYHEIYLNDPLHTDPADRRTLLRQPVA